MRPNTAWTPTVSGHEKTRPHEYTVGTSFQLQELEQDLELGSEKTGYRK